ncbi:hypothetical protein PCK1_002397 [Pneumocystis canis]|nr:hypothetical protein PCK1_002397 [Pneumocystis canis]
MRVSIFSIFIGIICVLSKDSSVLEHKNDLNFILETRNHINQHHTPQYHSFDRLKESSDILKRNIFEMAEKIETISSNNLYSKKQNNINKRLSFRGINQENNEKNYKALQAVSSYLLQNRDISQCRDIQKEYRTLLKTIKSEGKGMSELNDTLSKDELCETLLKYLEELCHSIRLGHSTITVYDQNTCTEQLKKCKELQEICKNLLDESCKKLKDQCKTKDNTTDESTTVPIKDFFTKTHTVLTISTSVVIEMADETVTVVETVIETKTCSCKYREWNPSSKLIEKELERIKNNHKLEAIDLSRYTSFKEPVTSDKETWIHTVNKSLISYEFIKGRVENLRLLQEFGKTSWLFYIEQLENYLRQLETQLLAIQNEISLLNRERKKFQTEDMGLELRRLENEFRQYIKRIFDVEIANILLEKEIQGFQNNL